MFSFALLEATALLPHEQIEGERLVRLTRTISRDGYLRQPVLVDRSSLVILDGHHRVGALAILGYAIVPAYLVDYRGTRVRVRSRRAGVAVDKDGVVERGTGRRPYPPRTSRHVFDEVPPPRPIDLELLATLGTALAGEAPAAPRGARTRRMFASSPGRE